MGASVSLDDPMEHPLLCSYVYFALCEEFYTDTTNPAARLYMTFLQTSKSAERQLSYASGNEPHESILYVSPPCLILSGIRATPRCLKLCLQSGESQRTSKLLWSSWKNRAAYGPSRQGIPHPPKIWRARLPLRLQPPTGKTTLLCSIIKRSTPTLLHPTVFL